jgi:ATP-binding cassette subfamily F protein uup
LAELPKKIDDLHAEIASLHQAWANPDLYRRDAASFASKTARLGAAQTELDAAETEWLELEILREELQRNDS